MKACFTSMIHSPSFLRTIGRIRRFSNTFASAFAGKNLKK